MMIRFDIIQNTGNNVDFIAVSKNIRCKVSHHSPARFNRYIIPEYIYKLSPAGISSEKLSSQVQFTLRLVLLRKVSSEKLSSQIQFCLRLVLLRKTKNPAMFQNQGKWSLRHPFSKLSLQINFEDAWGSWLGFGIFILNWILSYVPHPKFWLSILILKVQRKSMSLKS